MKTHAKKIHQPNIRQRLIIIVVSFVLFMGLAISITSDIIYRSYFQNTILRAADTNLQLLGDYIDHEMENADELAFFCQNNSSIANFINGNYKQISTCKVDAYNALSDYYASSSSSKYWFRVVVSNLTNSFLQIISTEYSSAVNIPTALPYETYYEDLSNHGYMNYGVGLVTDNFVHRSNVNVVPLLKPITYRFNSNMGGYLFLEITPSLFTDAIDNIDIEPGDKIVVTMGEHSYVYQDKELLPLALDAPIAELRVLTLDGVDYRVVTQNLNRKNVSVSQLIAEPNMHADMRIFNRLIVLLFLVLALVGVMLYGILGRVINEPVAKIQKRLTEISQGDFSRDTSIEWPHELGEIGAGVNNLAEDIEKLIETQIKDERKKRDLEYKVLQTQINPHFLYNTLNSIKWMAQVQGATGITEMTTALSRLLKSISKGTNLLIPLSEEINLLKDYFTIQQYRYGGTITMNIVSDGDFDDCTILKFTLQPLVENAIFHGIEPTGEAGTVTVHLYEEGESLRIDITDDGVGMDEATISRVLLDNSLNKSDFFKELGISNVHKRLQYEFGPEYGITITSKLGEYTTMSIRIPKHTLEMDS